MAWVPACSLRMAIWETDEVFTGFIFISTLWFSFLKNSEKKFGSLMDNTTYTRTVCERWPQYVVTDMISCSSRIWLGPYLGTLPRNTEKNQPITAALPATNCSFCPKHKWNLSTDNFPNPIRLHTGTIFFRANCRGHSEKVLTLKYWSNVEYIKMNKTNVGVGGLCRTYFSF